MGLVIDKLRRLYNKLGTDRHNWTSHWKCLWESSTYEFRACVFQCVSVIEKGLVSAWIEK